MSQHRFLGPDDIETIRQVRALDPDTFALAEEVAEQSSQVLATILVPLDDRLLTMALLFRRIVAAYEAMLVLAERGMLTEGAAVQRSQLEALFVLGGLWHRPELLDVYLANDLHRRRDLYGNIRKLSKSARDALSPELAPAFVDAEHARLSSESKGVTYMGVERWAQAARLHDLYLTQYGFLSEGVHHVAKDIERHVALNSDQDVEALQWGPEADPPSKLLVPAMDHILVAEECIFGAFGLKDRASWSILRERLSVLAHRHIS